MKRSRIRWWQMCVVMAVCSHESQLDPAESVALLIDDCEVVVVMEDCFEMEDGRGGKGLIGFVYRDSATLALIARLPSELTILRTFDGNGKRWHIDFLSD